MKHYAIIVAGGSGSRMQTDIPKQFLLLNGLPVLMHTIKAFHYSFVHPEILLVLNPDYINYWNELKLQYQFTIPHQIIQGGNQRFYSVKNALDFIEEDAVIGIHDAVRPIISNGLIQNCYFKAKEQGSAIPVINSRDSLRQVKGKTTIALNRDEILIVQTPQVFTFSILKQAYSQPFSNIFTDDASVVENAGLQIHTVEGDSKNIKITYPEDLEIAALFLK